MITKILTNLRNIRSLAVTVTLLVGESEEPLLVHKDVLCAASPVFESACKIEWEKAEDRVIRLKEYDPRIVEILVTWMYNDEIYFPSDLAIWIEEQGDCKYTRSDALALLTIMAENFQMPRLLNDIVDSFLRLATDFPPDSVHLRSVDQVYRNTSSTLTDGVRKALIQILGFSRNNETFLDQLNNQEQGLHRDLYKDLILASLTYSEKFWSLEERDIITDRCPRYHIHPEEYFKGPCCGRPKEWTSQDEEDNHS